MDTGMYRKYGMIAALGVSAALAAESTTDWSQMSGEIIIPAGETWYADESDMAKVNALTSITLSGAETGDKPVEAATLVFRDTSTAPKADLLKGVGVVRKSGMSVWGNYGNAQTGFTGDWHLDGGVVTNTASGAFGNIDLDDGVGKLYVHPGAALVVNSRETEFFYRDLHIEGSGNLLVPRVVDYKPLAGNYINVLDSTINELRETSGNTETSTGSSTKGVTAASALAALQEASGKTSRASTISSYRAFESVVYLVIELVRQFYNMPRQFRITGEMGVQKFIAFSNKGMQPQSLGAIGGVDLGIRTPVYDIEVAPEKRSSYTRLAQNELALQFYQMGFFNPQMSDQALACLDMMDFDGKDELMQKVAQNGTMFQELQLYKAFAATLAAKAEPGLVPGLLNGAPQPMPKREGEKAELDKGTGEASHVAKAREKAATASQPGGSSA